MEDTTPHLQALPGEFSFTIKVVRKETGLEETYHMVGTPLVENTEQDEQCQ